MAGDHSETIHDVSWLAIPTLPPVDLFADLELSDAVQVTWRQGIAAVCGDYWDFEAEPAAYRSRVFLPPPIRGWQLVTGGWFGGHEGDERLESIAHLCCDLSRRYGHAYAFTTQGRMDFYAWTLAHEGSLARHFVWDSGIVADIGSPVPAERSRVPTSTPIGSAPREPTEALVMAIAAEWSVSPLALAETDWGNAKGMLATTAWGRQYGIPTRPLE
jgi:hypothetical protein